MDNARPAGTATSRLWLWYISVGVALIVAYYVLLSPPYSSLMYNVFCLSAAIAMWWRSRDRQTPGHTTWLLLAIGFSCLSIGDLAWSFDEVVRGIETPFPSLADGLFLVAYPFLATAFVLLSRVRGRRSDRGTLLDAAIIGLVYCAAAWFFFLEPYLTSDSFPLLERLVSAAYPATDILIVGAIALLLLTPGKRPFAFYLLTFGTIAYICADVFYARNLLMGSQSAWMYAVWMVGALCWGAAALHPTLPDAAQPSNPQPLALTRSRLVLLAIASLSIPALQLLTVGHDDPSDRYVIIGVTSLMFLLVVLRLGGLVKAVAAQERRFRALVQYGGDLIAVVEPDGRIGYASPSFRNVLGYDPSELIGNIGMSLVAPDNLAHAEAMNAELIGTSGSQKTAEVDVRHADGSIRTLEATSTNLGNDSDVAGMIVNARDITARKRASEAFKAAQIMSTSVIESSVDGIFALDVESRITVWNRAMERTTGLTRDKVIGQLLLERFPFMVTTGESNLVAAALQGQTASAPTQPNRIDSTGKDGFYEARYAPLIDDAGAVVGAIGVVRDVTSQKRLEAELEHQAFHDSLTGLPNRALFSDRLEHALAMSSRLGEPIAVLLLDLDRFKLVNDGLGHAAGDQLLISVTNRLAACVRDADTLARLGGDEFVILLEGTSTTEAHVAADRIIAALAEPLNVVGREIFMSTSIGIAVSSPDFTSPVELLRAADIALYRAKSAGRNTTVVFDPATNDPTANWLTLEVDLRRAVTHREFVLHYQPVVDLNSGAVVSLEALARWNHPTRGMLAPDIFIPLAEETGLITALTEWAIIESCRNLAAWQSDLGHLAPPTINVNVTTRDLRDPALCDRIAHALADAGLPPSALRLEVTEHVLVEELREAAGTLRAIGNLGVRLAIDDFGAGASSLASLRAVKADVLKLDRTFIRNMEDNADDRVVVGAVAAMAHALGIVVTAEGIETQAQFDLARAAGCDRGQGYLFARPLPADELRTWLIRRDSLVRADQVQLMYA